ncbi:MAG TPA: adenylate/guanylate cyclase domain-containing protein [Gaiellaceae bacterium]|nr:adenylate/guanylate cyclase domain-containing protein [Gaiellaceae bacterium]
MRRLQEGTVTLLFTDIEGSTLLLREAGDDYAELLDTHRRLLSAAFARHRGHVVDSEGDAFFVAFPSAADCLAAAAEAQSALAAHPWPPGREVRVRMGIHTGTPRLVDGRYIGLDVHHAARVMAAAHGGQVVVSHEAASAADEGFDLRDLGEHRLKDLLGPQRLHQLVVPGLPAEFPPLKTLGNRFTNLPVLSSTLIGRDAEIARVTATVRSTRLVTLTGPGGIGKTRLAIQSAAELLEDFSSGVYFVSLTEVHDPSLVVPTIARTLALQDRAGLTTEETLVDYVSGRQLLFVLDNFEQVVAAAKDLSRLMQKSPDCRLLVTSREPLRIDGEQMIDVPSLALPEGDTPEGTEAVELFAARATASDDSFRLDASSVPDVVEIVRRLEGIPLAIELAAARVRALPLQVIIERLDRRLDLLTGGGRDRDERQRTLAATIQWSYDLLEPSEQRLFSRLAAFPGGTRLEAAEAITGATIDGITSLVDKSLLRRRLDPDGAPRYWMLETIREYAVERLAETGDAGIRATFATYYLEWANERSPRWISDYDDAAGAIVAAEETNLRAASDLLSPRERLCLAASTYATYYQHGRLREGRALLEAALAEAPGNEYWTAFALGGLSACAFRLGDLDPAEAAGRRAVELARSLEDGRLLAHVLRDWANALVETGRLAEGEAALREAVEVARAGGDGPGTIGALINLGHLALVKEDWQRAIDVTTEADALATELGWDLNVGRVMRTFNTAFAQFKLGNVDAAEAGFVEALLVVDRSFVEGIAYPLSALAAVAAARGDATRAVFLLGLTDALVEEHDMVYDEVENRTRVALRRTLLTKLGEGQFEVAYLAGRAAAIEDVIDAFSAPAA